MNEPVNAATYRRAVYDLALGEKPKVVAEVGVYAGDLSKMLVTLPGLKALHVIDSWKGDYCKKGQPHMDAIAASVIKWGKVYPRVLVRRLDSLEAAPLFDDESIDFWHTDGDHSLEGIRNDIRAWMPKVKRGCLMTGDNFEIPTVAQGVAELCPDFKLLAKGRLWYWRKP